MGENKEEKLAEFNDLASFIQITKQEILDQPNDQELGRYVRELFNKSSIVETLNKEK
jgi:hypothetical protein